MAEPERHRRLCVRRVALLGVMMCSVVRAQPQVDVRFHFIAQAEMKSVVTGLSTDAPKLEVASLDVVYSHPVQIGGTTWWLNHLTFRRENVEVGETVPITFPESVPSASSRKLMLQSENYLRLGYDTRLSHGLGSWTIAAAAGVQLSASDTDAGLGNVVPRGAILVDYHTPSGWTIGVGTAYTHVLGYAALIPTLHLESGTGSDVSASGGWRLMIHTPQAAIWYGLRGTAVSYGAMAELDGAEYHLLDRRATLYDRRGNILDPNTDVSLGYSTATAGPAARLDEYRGVSGLLQIGWAMRRQYRFRSIDQSQSLHLPPAASAGAGEPLHFDLADTLFIRAHLTYRFGES
jgi:hypothetical protein